VKGVVGGMGDEQYKKALEQGREKTKEMYAKRA
jgi:ubiquitin carboxyl-terminal hydrolase L5